MARHTIQIAHFTHTKQWNKTTFQAFYKNEHSDKGRYHITLRDIPNTLVARIERFRNRKVFFKIGVKIVAYGRLKETKRMYEDLYISIVIDKGKWPRPMS